MNIGRITDRVSFTFYLQNDLHSLLSSPTLRKGMEGVPLKIVLKNVSRMDLYLPVNSTSVLLGTYFNFDKKFLSRNHYSHYCTTDVSYSIRGGVLIVCKYFSQIESKTSVH